MCIIKTNDNDADRLPPELLAVWARDTLGLSKADYNRKCLTVKNLKKIWAAFPNYSAKDSLLIDDSALKGRLQPRNILPLPVFDPYDKEKPFVEDMDLLATVGILDAIEDADDIAQALSQQFTSFSDRDAVRKFIDHGKQVCQRLGISIADDFDANWFHERAPSAYQQNQGEEYKSDGPSAHANSPVDRLSHTLCETSLQKARHAINAPR